MFALAPIVDIAGTNDKAAYFGNLARNTLIAPGPVNVDFSVVKNTAITENTNLQFRAEFFNIFNRANFGLPGPNPLTRGGGVDPSAGVITRTVTDNFQTQFGLKFIF